MSQSDPTLTMQTAPPFAQTMRLSESPFAPAGPEVPAVAPETLIMPKPAPMAADAPPAPRSGRIVHFVLQGEAESHGTHRPGVITQVNPDGTVSIHVWTDDNDGGRYAHGHYFAHFISQDETDKQPGTWHWPERD